MLGYSIEDFVINCQFNSESCYLENWKWFFDNWHGNCYQFNHGYNETTGKKIPLRKSVRASRHTGLEMELYVGRNESLGNNFAFLNGIHLFIHNNSDTPFQFDGLDLSVGTHTDVVIDRLFIKKIENPYSECVSDTEIKQSKFYKYLMETKLSYRRRDCYYKNNFFNSINSFSNTIINNKKVSICAI